MSFLDDMSSCGLACSLCTAGTASNAEVDGMGACVRRGLLRAVFAWEPRVRCVSNGSRSPGALHLDERGHARLEVKRLLTSSRLQLRRRRCAAHRFNAFLISAPAVRPTALVALPSS